MNDYSQPYFIRIGQYNGKGEFLGRYKYGYLPPLELPHEEAVVAYADMEWTNRQWYRVEQLEGRVKYLQSKYQDQVAERKQSGKLFISKKT